MKTPDALPEGTTIGNYVVAEVLGQGGGAITYYCTDTLLGREVALKEHFPQGLCRRSAEGCVVAAAGMEEVFERSVDVFLNEARTVAGLKHPHIVPIHDVLAARGTAYAVLELEEGKLLDAWLTAHAAEPRRIQAVLETLLGVLSYLHERSVFHRDIKPANILVRAGDDPVLLDFGAAHVGDFTGQRTIIGTPQFAAPEQFSEEGELGPWSDLYALGSSFLHGLGAEATAALPRRLRQSLYQATRKQPERRFRSAAEWERALHRPARWPWCILALLLLTAAAVGGWCLYPQLADPDSSMETPSPAPAEAPATDSIHETTATPAEEKEADLADIPQSLNGYTLHLLTQEYVCYQTRADLQHWEQMAESDVINTLKDAFFEPKREPINAKLNPNYFSFGEKTWKIEDAESDYSYKRMEGSALSLLTVSNVKKTARKPYLLWFSSPTEGRMAFPVDNGLNVWSHVRFRLEPNEQFKPQLRPKTEAPDSPAGMYLLFDHSDLQSYPVKPDSPAEPDTATDKTQRQILSILAYSSVLFLDTENWESGDETGTYTYEKINSKEVRVTLRFNGSDRVLSLYLQFSRSTAGLAHEHELGEEEAFCNILFEIHPFGVSPHGGTFSMFFKGDDLRPTAAPTPK